MRLLNTLLDAIRAFKEQRVGQDCKRAERGDLSYTKKLLGLQMDHRQLEDSLLQVSMIQDKDQGKPG